MRVADSALTKQRLTVVLQQQIRATFLFWFSTRSDLIFNNPK